MCGEEIRRPRRFARSTRGRRPGWEPPLPQSGSACSLSSELSRSDTGSALPASENSQRTPSNVLTAQLASRSSRAPLIPKGHELSAPLCDGGSCGAHVGVVGCTAPHEGTTDASSWWVLAAYPTRRECESKCSVLHRQRSSDDASYECLPDTVARAEGEVVSGRVDRLLGTRNQT